MPFVFSKGYVPVSEYNEADRNGISLITNFESLCITSAAQTSLHHLIFISGHSSRD